MCFHSFPNPLGIAISQLQTGDEIIVLQGEGTPEAAEDTLCVVVAVSGFSALTSTGISISCMNISDLIVTGRHFDEYEISEAAAAILAEIEEKRRQEAMINDWEHFPEDPLELL